MENNKEVIWPWLIAARIEFYVPHAYGNGGGDGKDKDTEITLILYDKDKRVISTAKDGWGTEWEAENITYKIYFSITPSAEITQQRFFNYCWAEIFIHTSGKDTVIFEPTVVLTFAFPDNNFKTPFERRCKPPMGYKTCFINEHTGPVTLEYFDPTPF